MILTCPQCATRYQVDEAKFPPAGRTVRCAKCGHNWHQPGPERAEPEPAPLEDFLPKDEGKYDSPEAGTGATADLSPAPSASPPPPSPTPSPTRAAAAARPAQSGAPRTAWAGRLALAAGWLALGAIVLLIAFSAVRYRQDIATAWPQSAALYSTLGLSVNQHGIDLVHVAYSREIEDGQSVLAVTGAILNSAARELPVPQTIRVTLTDASNHELYHWTFPANVQTLGPGRSVTFKTRLSSPPSGARHLEMRFDAP